MATKRTTRTTRTAKTGGQAARNAPSKPNILIIWGDDIGWYNISACKTSSSGTSTT
jgi:hypothetical protein